MSAMLGQTILTANAPAPELIDELVIANKILFHQNVVDAFGHVSVRHDKDRNKYLMARHLPPQLVTVADFKGRKIINYRCSPVVFATNGGARYGCGPKGTDEFEICRQRGPHAVETGVQAVGTDRVGPYAETEEVQVAGCRVDELLQRRNPVNRRTVGSDAC